ncbi:type IV secretion system DNA-binding domain-containing protein [bacterium]|nr:type IV secretion system DNA-binding domain-containing protein [bacterium]
MKSSKSYQSYETFLNRVRMSVKMHLGILRMLFGVHVILVAVFLIVTIYGSSSITKWDFERYYGLGLASFAIYLLHPLVVFFFHRRSRQTFQEKTKRGSALISERKLRGLLPKPAYLPISEVLQLPYAFETTHVLFGGTTGSGKTTFIDPCIRAVKDRGGRGVVLDCKDGEFVAKHYDPQRDYLFNPFDARSLHWDAFDVIENDADFDALAGSVVPQNATKDRFFSGAGRDVLSGLFRWCYGSGRRSNDDIWQALCQPVPQLHKMLQSVNSAAAAYVENYESPQTQGVVSTMMQHAKVFKYLVNTHEKSPFSLRRWVRDDDHGGLIFLPSHSKQRPTLRSIFGLFINCLSNEILSLRDDPARRISVFLDEFTSLPPLDSIKDLLTLGRSKGGNFWIGIQEKAQLDALYGKETANTIANQCSTQVIFRMNDVESSEYFSTVLGQRETESMESTFSSGSRDRRDSESYRYTSKTDRLVLPSQIQSLPNLAFYLRIHSFPITQCRIRYKAYDDREPAFVPNEHFLANRSTKPESNPPPHPETDGPMSHERPQADYDNPVDELNF